MMLWKQGKLVGKSVVFSEEKGMQEKDWEEETQQREEGQQEEEEAAEAAEAAAEEDVIRRNAISRAKVND